MNDAVEYRTLTPRNVEEPAARCNICGSGLSSVEHLLYGNRCLFCAPDKSDISFWFFIQNVTLDFLIYRQALKWSNLKEKCTDCQDGQITQIVEKSRHEGEKDKIDTFACPSCNGRGELNLGRLKMIGFLGSVGAAYYEELTIKHKKELLSELKRQ